MENIVEMDAIIARGEDDAPHEPEWPVADAIVGNPPFLGGKRLRAELQDEYVDRVFALYDDRVAHEADLVCYWFEKARAQVQQGRAGRAGLLATNSIRGGANRRVLARIKDGGDIFFAESDRPWILDGAAVRVSMVGFDGASAKQERERVLDGAPAEEIFSDLTGGVDLTRAVRLPENAGISFMGDTKGGPFDLSPEKARELLATGGNPNGRPNSDVVKPWINGLDITRRPRGYQIIDFDEAPLEGAELYEAPFEHVREHVKPARENNKQQGLPGALVAARRAPARDALRPLRAITVPSTTVPVTWTLRYPVEASTIGVR
jgi:type II restriction/modification system DNA methylase subunit YeeA